MARDRGRRTEGGGGVVASIEGRMLLSLEASREAEGRGGTLLCPTAEGEECRRVAEKRVVSEVVRRIVVRVLWDFLNLVMIIFQVLWYGEALDILGQPQS